MTGAAPRVEGVRETLKALKEFDPKLRRATNKRIRNSVRPLQDAARARLPGLPLSGWMSGRYGYDQSAARKGVKAQIGGRGRSGRTTWPLITVRQTNAGAAVFDMAGRRSSGSSPQGAAFIRGLNRSASASRSMWPAAEEKIDVVRGDVLAAIEDASKLVNRDLRRK